MPRGDVVLTYEFTKERSVKKTWWGETCSGTGRLIVNGQPVGEAKITGAILASHQGPGSMGIGQAFGSPVRDAFQPPYRFTGTLIDVEVELK